MNWLFALAFAAAVPVFAETAGECELFIQAPAWRPPAPTPHSEPLTTIQLLRTVWRNPLEAWNKDHFEKPFVTAKIAGLQATVINDPAGVKRVLMENRANYEK